jgi:hypothetical protein
MLEDQQSPHRIRRRTPPSPATAFAMAFRQCLVHDRDNLLICQHLVGVIHPIFAKIANLFRDYPVAETELLAPHLNHAASSARLMSPALDAAGHD